MVDFLTKGLRRLSPKDRRTADHMIDILIRGEAHNFDIKKLRGHENVFRARKGRLRVIYMISQGKVIILDVGLRSDTTYKKY